MKKIILLSLSICIISCLSAHSQGSLLRKAANSISNDLSGKPKEQPKEKIQPEPACACDAAEQILDLGGKFKIDYTEMNITVAEDGSILIQDRLTSEYYIVKGKTTVGPLKEGDPKLAQYVTFNNAGDDDESSQDALVKKYKDYITKSGEKYTITFAGKKYGPYAIISSFSVNTSKTKFASIVTENVAVTENQAQKMEEAMKNAKTDQERMDIAMKFSQSMATSMRQSGGPESLSQKIVSNIPGAKIDPMRPGIFSTKMKYDEIVIVRYDGGVMDIEGNDLIQLNQDYAFSEVFINTSNTMYAVDTHGALTFSDNTTLSELFNPQFVKADGKIFLAYMYYSPKRNSIMQCRIPF